MRKVVKEVHGNTTSRQTIRGSQSTSMRFHGLSLIFTKHAFSFIFIDRYLFSFMQIYISFRAIHSHSDSLISVIEIHGFIFMEMNDCFFFIHIHREACHLIANKFIFIEN